jgi:nucleotide-binding universal stress UspA family protein
MEHKLLLASDGSENALQAAEYVINLAVLAPEIKVTVLVVNDILEKIKNYTPLGSPIVLGEVEDYFREKTQDALNKTLALFKKHQTPVEGVIRMGYPAQEIVDLAREGGYSQIVIGSRGMGAIKGIVLGSVSSKVIHLSAVPVTVVK